MTVEKYLILLEPILLILIGVVTLVFQERLAMYVFEKKIIIISVKRIWKTAIALAIVESSVFSSLLYATLYGLHINLNGIRFTPLQIVEFSFVIAMIANTCINFSSITNAFEIQKQSDTSYLEL